MKKFNGKKLLSTMFSAGYDVMVDYCKGAGLEYYDGCERNLMMILEDEETDVQELTKEDKPEYWREGERMFKVFTQYTFIYAEIYIWIAK